MTTRVPVNPRLLRWAGERASLSPQRIRDRFPKFDEWEVGDRQPTLKQLEDFARATRTPIGYFFLPEPPEIDIPIPDFRTIANERLDHPSPDLLDTIYLCQQRQEWYRDYMLSLGESPMPFVGSATTDTPVAAAADLIRDALDFDLDHRRQCSTWTEALRTFIDQADQLGVLVMVSGVVGSNNKRSLDPAEFRGFALADDLAPLVFINGKDTKSAQMFTLAHELAHLWLGETALSDTTAAVVADHHVENWCNRVAAEMLVPLDVFQETYDTDAPVHDEKTRLARRFKVSNLVILRRMYDAGGLDRDRFWQLYNAEVQYLRSLTSDGGGNWYNTTPARTSKRFARAVVTSTLEGQTLYTHAFRLLGCRSLSSFNNLGEHLGVSG